MSRSNPRRVDADSGWVERRFRALQDQIDALSLNSLQAVPGSAVSIEQVLTDPNSTGAYEADDITTAVADDTAVTLTLTYLPIPESLKVWQNGVRVQATEFTRDGQVVTIPPSAGVIIRTGDDFSAHYRWDTTAATNEPATLFDERMADAPIAYYRFGETSGTTIVDSSGNAHDGIAGYAGGYTLGATSLDDSDPANAAVDIDPATVDVSIPFDTWMNVTEITVVSLIDPDDVTTGRVIAARDNNGTTGPWNLRIDSTGVIQWSVWTSGGQVNAYGSTPINVGDRHDIAGTFDGTTAQIYVDGVLDGSASVTGTLSAHASQKMWIGRYNATGGPFDGALDEMAVYDYALSADRLLIHAQAAGVA